MADLRFGRQVRLAVVLVVLSTVTGCTPGAGTAQGTSLLSQHAARHGVDAMAAARVAGLLTRMRNTVTHAEQVKGLSRFNGSSLGVQQTTTTQISSILRQLPRKQTAEMTRLAAQLRRARQALDDISGIQQAADRRVAQLPTDARQLTRATGNAEAFLSPAEALRLRRVLADKAREQALELGCDLLWDGLVPSDKQTVLTANRAGQVVPTHAEGLHARTPQAVIDGAYQAAEFALGRLAGPRVVQAVAWGTYAEDVIGKARALQANDYRALHQINASGYTTALIHYSRICLRPPR
jgi:hypothetical protein